jgi:hypothetical protein
MNAVFDQLLAELETGTPIQEGDWSFVPLKTKRRGQIDYLTMLEAVESGLATVAEVNPQGAVADMKVENKGALPVLIPDGLTLMGCRQNRAVNLTILIPAKSTTVIPVSCVEQGRWRPETQTCSPSEMCDPQLRSAMCRQATEELRACRDARADQHSVWEHVSDVLGSAHAQSPTRAYHAAYSAARPREIACPEGATGIATIRDGRICSLDLFDKPATLRKLWPRIVRGTIIPAPHAERRFSEVTDTRRFLATCLSEPQGEFAAIGLGTHHRFGVNGSVAAALVVDGQILHLSAFQGNRTPKTPNSGPQPNPASRRSW